jgi:hypothetical protein
VKTIQELFALLVSLYAMLMRFVELLSLAMLLRKRIWRGEQMVKSVFGGGKNLPLKESDGFCQLGYQYGIGCEKDAERTNENFLAAAEPGHAQSMVFLGGLFDKNDPQRFFGLEELLQMDVVFPSWKKWRVRCATSITELDRRRSFLQSVER